MKFLQAREHRSSCRHMLSFLLGSWRGGVLAPVLSVSPPLLESATLLSEVVTVPSCQQWRGLPAAPVLPTLAWLSFNFSHPPGGGISRSFHLHFLCVYWLFSGRVYLKVPPPLVIGLSSYIFWIQFSC